MLVKKVSSDYLIYGENSISEALVKINNNKGRLIFVVSEHGVLLGSLSDGDLRRWLLEVDQIDLSLSCSAIMNEKCVTFKVGTPQENIKLGFGSGVRCLPLLDEAGRIVSLAFDEFDGFQIGERIISDSTPSFIIAEIGNNHQGDIRIAKRLVDAVVESGADCAKFQMRNMDKLYRKKEKGQAAVDLGAEYTLDLLERFQLTEQELFEVFDYCKSVGLEPLCTPWDLASLQSLDDYGMRCYKVASADFTNYQLIEAIAATGKPMFVSTGMASESEINQGIKKLDEIGASYILLHCNSTYPTPFKDVNLSYLSRLRDKTSNGLIGYSGHERGVEVPIGAVALGANVIEKHLTFDKTQEGTDHKVSLLPNELKNMVVSIRNLEDAMSKVGAERELTQGEMINRENLAKSVVAKIDIAEGTKISPAMLDIRTPGQGLQPNRIEELVGTACCRTMSAGDYFFESDIDGGFTKKEVYSFDRPVGVPVRYHDFEAITEGVNLDFVEFHLSYKDLELNLDEFLNHEYSIGFAVHSPELFFGDHILDLASFDDQYKARSIQELKKVIQETHDLMSYFPKTESPVIVLNAGGWSQSGFVGEADKQKKYQILAESLAKVGAGKAVIAIQTMPPFPWHFGGQSFHNLFVDADEIVSFCKANPSIKVCLDISHTMMACNYYGWDLYEFITKVAPYVVHMHIVDAKGVDGEGVEVGCGDVDFEKLGSILNSFCPKIQFIPEVWQGHKNNGEGFWKALEFLELKF